MGHLARAAAWLAVFGGVAMAIVWWAAGPAMPDAFYALPAQRPTTPGVLLRSEPFTRTVPRNASAWRILYTTTRADNSFAVASAVVMIPTTAARQPRPVIAWAHGTTGIAPGCAPSLMAKPLANVPALDQLIGEGWAYVATDYVGLGTAGGHAYLVGDDAARAVLDSVRAARQLSDLSLDERVVVWGHSQGGNSALWVGIRGADYAPDVTLQGIAAFAPASDLKGLVAAGRSTTFGKIVSAYLLLAYSTTYPDVKVEDYMLGRASLLKRRLLVKWKIADLH
jgi:hypothetical protein